MPAKVMTRNGPDFLCIGQQKAGTGWLYDMLQFEPGFWMPPVKELKFFNNNFPVQRMRRKFPKGMARMLGELNRKRQRQRKRLLDVRDVEFAEHAFTYKKGRVSTEWYTKLFAPKDGLVSGDISPAYSSLDSETIAAIAGALPDLHILLLLRDPVSRAWSHFNMIQRLEVIGRHHQGLGKATEELELAFQRPTSTAEVVEFLHLDRVRRRSFPTAIYENWTRHFDPSQINVVFFEEIVNAPDVVIKRFREDLGLTGDVARGDRVTLEFNRKSGELKRELSDEVRAVLVEAFRDEMLRCADVFGGAAEQWPQRYGIA